PSVVSHLRDIDPLELKYWLRAAATRLASRKTCSARPARPTLVEKRAEALLALVARPPLGDPALGAEPVRPLEHELLRVARRLGPGGSHLGNDRGDTRVEIRGHFVHQPDPERGGGVEALARDEVAPTRARPDLREGVGRDHGRDDPELHLGEGEL